MRTTLRMLELGFGTLLCLVLALACGGRTSEAGTDSSTHFWSRCVQDADCDEGLNCECNRCTERCAENSECEDFNGAVCGVPDLDCRVARRVCLPAAELPNGSSQEAGASGGDAAVPSSLIDSGSGGMPVGRGPDAGRSDGGNPGTSESLVEWLGAEPSVWNVDFVAEILDCDIGDAANHFSLQWLLEVNNGTIFASVTGLEPKTGAIPASGSINDEMATIDGFEALPFIFPSLSFRREGETLVAEGTEYEVEFIFDDIIEICRARSDLVLVRDHEPPVASYQLPELAVRDGVVVTFNEPIALDEAEVEIVSSITQDFDPASIAIGGTAFGFTLTPRGFWNPAAEYSLRIEGVRDLAGLEMAAIIEPLSVLALPASSGNPSFEDALNHWVSGSCAAVSDYQSPAGQLALPTDGDVMAQCEGRVAGFFEPGDATSLSFELATLCPFSPQQVTITPCEVVDPLEVVVRIVNANDSRDVMPMGFPTPTDVVTFQTLTLALDEQDAGGFWLEIIPPERSYTEGGIWYTPGVLVDAVRFE